MGFLIWWSERSAWLRYGVALFFILLSTVLFFFFDRFWPWGWGLGAVLLFFAGKSQSEKSGYKF